jgi:hypothetical protein
MKRLSLIDGPDAAPSLKAACEARGLDELVLRELINAVRGRNGQLRRRGLYDQFDSLLAPRAGDETA